MTHRTRKFLIAFALVGLSACGGGGDQGDDSKTTPNPPACIERPELCT